MRRARVDRPIAPECLADQGRQRNSPERLKESDGAADVGVMSARVIHVEALGELDAACSEAIALLRELGEREGEPSDHNAHSSPRRARAHSLEASRNAVGDLFLAADNGWAGPAGVLLYTDAAKQLECFLSELKIAAQVDLPRIADWYDEVDPPRGILLPSFLKNDRPSTHQRLKRLAATLEAKRRETFHPSAEPESHARQGSGEVSAAARRTTEPDRTLRRRRSQRHDNVR